jgi:hypothetical protein
MHLKEMHRRVRTAFESKRKARGEGSNVHEGHTKVSYRREIEMFMVVSCI